VLGVCVQLCGCGTCSVLLICVVLLNWVNCEGVADLFSEGFGEELPSKNECTPANEASRAAESTGEDSCLRRNSRRYENKVSHYQCERCVILVLCSVDLPMAHSLSLLFVVRRHFYGK
jgi:hypothetical protein